MSKLPKTLYQAIRNRPHVWREVCLLSLELLEGTNEHVSRVLWLYRNGSTAKGFLEAANAAYTAANGANAAYAAASAANAAANAAASAAYAAYTAVYTANAAVNAAYAAQGEKLERFIVDLTLLVEFAPPPQPSAQQEAVL